MAARGTVYLRFTDGSQMTARTDLTGHGNVHVGEEFLARQVWPTRRKRAQRLLPGGKRLRVRVTAVEAVSRGYHILDVEILEDLTPAPGHQGELF